MATSAEAYRDAVGALVERMARADLAQAESRARELAMTAAETAVTDR